MLNSVTGASSLGSTVYLTPPRGGMVSILISPLDVWDTVKAGASSRLAVAAPGRALLNRPGAWGERGEDRQHKV